LPDVTYEKWGQKMGPGSNISYAFLFEEEKIEAKMKKWGLSPFYSFYCGFRTFKS